MWCLMSLDCFVQKLSKKNLWGVGSTFGKGRVEVLKDLDTVKTSTAIKTSVSS